MKSLVRFGMVVFALTLISALSLAAAEVGSITGKVLFKGKAPSIEAQAIEVNKEVCGHEQTSEELVVASTGGLQWAVVSLTGVAANPTATPQATINQKGCQFHPHVVVVPLGQKLKVKNSDGILHNVHTYPKENRATNRAQPGFMKQMELKFKKPEVVRMGCDVHSWMQSWIVVSEDIATVSGADGGFELAGVEPGTYELKIWHEKLGEQTKKVTVAPGKASEVVITFSAEQKASE